MKISKGEKLELTALFIDNDLENIIKKLIKMYNNNEGYEDILDNHFILKNLALTLKKAKRYEISKYYLKLAIENIESEKENYLLQYYELQWLNIELNGDKMNKKQIMSTYRKMYEYYKKNNHERNTYVILSSIYKLNQECEKMEGLLCEVVEKEFSQKEDAIKEILQDFKSFGDTYYTTALKIVNQSNRNNFIVL